MMYVKIFASILDSSVWHESPTTVKVWITFLVMADEHGFARGVEKAIAQRAVVSLDECRRAIEILEAPDLDSQTQEFAGRRIEKVEGGWQVLNYPKYREMRTREQVKEAERKARQRAGHRSDEKAPKSKSGKQMTDANVAADDVVPGHVPHVPTIASASPSEGVGAVEPRARVAVGITDGPPPLLEHFAEDKAGCEAYCDYRREARFASAFDAALRSAHEPLTGGAAYSWAVIGAALAEMRATGASFSPAVLRAFCARLARGELAVVPNTPGVPLVGTFGQSFAAAERERQRAKARGA